MKLPRTNCIKALPGQFIHNQYPALSFCRRAKADTTMIKFLLLALAFGLAHAHAELEGKWVTTAIGADNADIIEEGRPQRIYLRELACSDACNTLELTFYIKVNGQCTKTKVIGNKQADGKYRAQYEGDNIFGPVYATPGSFIFANQNVDRTGRTTNLIYVFGKGQPLTPVQYEKLEELAKAQNIPKENIQDILATDICPKK